MSEEADRHAAKGKARRLDVRTQPDIPSAGKPDVDLANILESKFQSEKNAAPVSGYASQDAVSIEQARCCGIIDKLMRTWFPGTSWRMFRKTMYDMVRGQAKYIYHVPPYRLWRLIRLLEGTISRNLAGYTPSEVLCEAMGQLRFEWPETQNPQQG